MNFSTLYSDLGYLSIALAGVFLIILLIICERSRRRQLKNYLGLRREYNELYAINDSIRKESKDLKEKVKHLTNINEKEDRLKLVNKKNEELAKWLLILNNFLQGKLIAYYSNENEEVQRVNTFVVENSKAIVEQVMPARGKGTKKQVIQHEAIIGFGAADDGSTSSIKDISLFIDKLIKYIQSDEDKSIEFPE